jgi:hypothetical protein
MKEWMANQRPGPFFASKLHERKHAPRIIVYTSVKTLNTTAGTKLRLPRGGMVTSVIAVVQTAPTSTFELDYLIDSTSVLNGYIQIDSGETISKYKPIIRPAFDANSVHQFQIVTVAAATGPLVVTIEYVEEF